MLHTGLGRWTSKLALPILAVAFALSVGQPARAADFVASCKAFSAGMNNGTPEPTDEQDCICIQGKLSADDQTNAAAAMDSAVDVQKTGKPPADAPAAQQAALEKAVEANVGCHK